MTIVEIRMLAEKTARETGRPDVVLLGELVAQVAELNDTLSARIPRVEVSSPFASATVRAAISGERKKAKL